MDAADYLALMHSGERQYEVAKNDLAGLTDPEAAELYRAHAAELDRQADATAALDPDVADMAREMAARLRHSAGLLSGEAN